MLKGAVGTTYILAAALAFTGVLPFSVLTSVIVAYGMAGEMVKLAETNLMSEWGWGGAGLGQACTSVSNRMQHRGRKRQPADFVYAH